MGAQKNHLIETVLLSTHNIIMFQLRNKKNNFQICTLIWRPATVLKYGQFKGVDDSITPELFDKILKKRFKLTISFERASSFTLSLTMLNPDTPILKTV